MTQRPQGLRARLRGDQGVGSVEYIGVILLVAAILGAVLVTVTPVGSTIAARICEALGTSCAEGAGSEPPNAHKPTDPCVADSTTDTRKIGVTAVADIDGGGVLITETLSDGTTRVTYQANGSVGIGIGVGAGVEVSVDDFVFGGSAQAGLSAAGILAGGTSWDFPPGKEGDAKKLAEHFQRQIDNQTTPVVGPIRAGWEALFGENYTPPEPTSYFGQIGATGSASASASAIAGVGAGGASASANAAVALGAKHNVKTGETTVYYEQVLDAAASASYIDPTMAAKAGASGELKQIIAVTLDPSGKYMTNVSVETNAFGDASASAAVLFGSKHDPSVAGGTQYTASVDLTGTETATIGANLLRSAGIPVPDTRWTPRGGSIHPAVDAFGQFVDAAKERGTLTRLTQTGDSATPFSINASGELGIGVGLRYENSSSRRTVDGAEYFDGNGWVPWTDCFAG